MDVCSGHLAHDNVNFTGSACTNGVGNSSNVGLYVKSDFNLIGNSVNLQAAQEYRLHEKSVSGSDESCFMWVACSTTSWTNYDHNESLLNKPINVTAQDIEVKAGNTLSTQLS